MSSLSMFTENMFSYISRLLQTFQSLGFFSFLCLNPVSWWYLLCTSTFTMKMSYFWCTILAVRSVNFLLTYLAIWVLYKTNLDQIKFRWRGNGFEAFHKLTLLLWLVAISAKVVVNNFFHCNLYLLTYNHLWRTAKSEMERMRKKHEKS